ncbi:unnamed protein product [Leuciscus chuanchicus]
MTAWSLCSVCPRLCNNDGGARERKRESERQTSEREGEYAARPLRQETPQKKGRRKKGEEHGSTGELVAGFRTFRAALKSQTSLLGGQQAKYIKYWTKIFGSGRFGFSDVQESPKNRGVCRLQCTR